MALPTTCFNPKDYFSPRHRHCILLMTAILYLTRTASVTASDNANTNLWHEEELNNNHKNELPEAGRSSNEAARSLMDAELWKPVSLGAGLSDITATVGRVFKFAVPEDAFRGDNLRYKITEAGRDSLPSWLLYNEDSQTLKGIPSEADLDQYYMQITAMGRSFNSTKTAHVTDIFSISVLPEKKVLSSSSASPLMDTGTTTTTSKKCSNDEAAIEATIILDANWVKMTVEQRLEVIAKMSKHSMLGVDAFRLLPWGSKSLLDGSLMVAGPGNVKLEKHPGVALSWKIGCSKTNSVDKFPVVTVLESASKDSSMATTLKHDIIGWRVTNDRPERLKRVRRQANLMGTPVPTPLPTVGTPKPTMVMDTSTVQVPTSTIITRSFTVVEPTPSMVPSITQPTERLRPTPTASPVKSTSSSTMMQSSSPSMLKPTMASSYVATVAPSSSVVKTRTSMPEPTPTPSTTSTMVTTPPTPTPTLPTTPTTKHTKPTTPITTQPITTPLQKPETTTMAPPTKPVNNAPTITRRLKRVDALEGKLLSFTIPQDTFFDAEDGNARNLSLVLLTLDLQELPKNSWLKFDKKEQRLYGLPLKEQARKKRYEYMLVAQDRDGEEVQDVFEVAIASAASADEEILPPVKMGITLDIDYETFINDPELQLFILNKIAAAFGDPNADAITITEIRQGSVIISWTNNTLPKNFCDNELILELQSKIMTADGKPTQALIDAFAPEFNITEVESLALGVCAPTTPPSIPSTTSEDPGAGGANQPSDMWISTVLPAVIIALILLVAGIIIFVLYRKSRKGKLSDEDQNTFINKGIPIIFADEIEDGEKPPSSSSPLIMKTEKPPLSPPEYTETQQPLISSSEQPGDDEDKQSLPMVDMSGTPSYQPPPPLSPSPPENRSNVPPRDISSYRKPPAYVHIQP